MKLLNNLKQKFMPKKKAEELDKAAEEAVSSLQRPYEISTPDPIKEIKGKVRTAKQPTYTPDVKRSGGRMVKTMPKPLKKMKEAQERTEDA